MDQLTADEVLEVRQLLAERRARAVDPAKRQQAITRDEALRQLALSFKPRLDAAPDKAARAAIIEEMAAAAKAEEQKYL